MIQRCLALALRLRQPPPPLLRRVSFAKSEEENFGVKFDEQEIKRKMM